MAHDWPLVPLGELVDPTRGISYGIVQPGEHVADGVPIIRAGDLRGDRIDAGSPLRVSNSIESNYSRTRLRGGELVMSIVGTVGQTAIIDEQFVGWNTARAVAVIPVLPDIGAYWVRVALKTPAARERIYSRLNTTVQATLNLKDVAELPITLPPLPERQAIASVLSALDDKIELNTRMNETLDATARAIYKDWFVDFGPTRAKMEGRAPYLARDIWSLFPDHLDDAGKPQGWRSRSIATTVIHLGKNDIDRFMVNLPAPEAVAAFNVLGQPLYDKIVANKLEMRTLTATRDFLLPKLMSREVRVKDAEKVVGKAT
jgi:type I restriction enzyme S subunit